MSHVPYQPAERGQTLVHARLTNRIDIVNKLSGHEPASLKHGNFIRRYRGAIPATDVNSRRQLLAPPRKRSNVSTTEFLSTSLIKIWFSCSIYHLGTLQSELQEFRGSVVDSLKVLKSRNRDHFQVLGRVHREYRSSTAHRRRNRVVIDRSWCW